MGLTLVTGGLGFIGSHIVQALLTAGEDVQILDAELRLTETVAEAEAAGYTVRLLEPMLDIDIEPDLEAAAAENLLSLAPRTAAEWQRMPIAR